MLNNQDEAMLVHIWRAAYGTESRKSAYGAESFSDRDRAEQDYRVSLRLDVRASRSQCRFVQEFRISVVFSVMVAVGEAAVEYVRCLGII